MSRRKKQLLEKPPTVLMHADKIDRELAHRLTLDVVSTRREKALSQFPPSLGFSDVDELAQTARPERQHRVRGRAVELSEERHCRHTRELANECGDACARLLIATRDRDDHGANAIQL